MNITFLTLSLVYGIFPWTSNSNSALVLHEYPQWWPGSKTN